MTKGLHVFISHSHDERDLALAWKDLIDQTSMGEINAWLSSDQSPEGGIPIGEQWADVIYERLRDATHVLAVLTPQSLKRHWIWWECGLARGVSRERKLIPIVHMMALKDLPEPMNFYQAYDGDDLGSVEQLCERLLAETKLKTYPQHWGSMLEEFRKKVTPGFQRNGVVLLDHSHGQQKWNLKRTIDPSILEADQVTAILQTQGINDVTTQIVDPRKQITRQILRYASGLVLAMPYKAKLQSDTVEAIVEWVRSGGRLLLLGYELGDRHHGGNLNDLAHAFGLHLESDIVTPDSWSTDEKPYGAAVTFSVQPNAHPVVLGMKTFSLVNSQTIRGEPGTVQILSVGSNRIGYIVNPADSVVYTNDTWCLPQGQQQLAFMSGGAMHGVLVQAPRGLTGEGSVLALGTWNFALDQVGEKFVCNLMRWLSRKL